MRAKLLLVASFLLFSFTCITSSATEIHPTSETWYLFDVDPLISQSGEAAWIDAQYDDTLGYTGDGSPLVFSFTLATSAFLNVVDAGISGDIFSLIVNGDYYSTSAVEADSNLFSGTDFESAWSTDAFSRLSILLAPGHYTLTGSLQQSAIDEFGSSYMATVGGIQIVEADEPGTLLLLCIGISAFLLRRRSATSRKTIKES